MMTGGYLSQLNITREVEDDIAKLSIEMDSFTWMKS